MLPSHRLLALETSDIIAVMPMSMPVKYAGHAGVLVSLYHAAARMATLLHGCDNDICMVVKWSAADD